VFINNFLQDRISIITGASSEIGSSIASALANAGSSVILVYNKHPKRAEQAAKRLLSNNKKATTIQADLRNLTDQHRLFVDYPRRTFNRPADILVYAASTPDRKSLADLNHTNIDSTLSLGPVSFLLCCRLFVEALHNSLGDIIAISSTAALAPYSQGHAYVASQGALMASVRSLALELTPRIRVNAVLPGIVETLRHLERQLDVERGKKLPIGRMIQPNEIAEGVLFLLHCRAIIGQGLIIDGGATIGYNK